MEQGMDGRLYSQAKKYPSLQTFEKGDKQTSAISTVSG